jgi:hypothetical protein
MSLSIINKVQRKFGCFRVLTSMQSWVIPISDGSVVSNSAAILPQLRLRHHGTNQVSGPGISIRRTADRGVGGVDDNETSRIA